MQKTVLLLASMSAAVLAACLTAALSAASVVGQTATLTGAGDIASCTEGSSRATAKLIGKIRGTVFTLGDHAYPEGTAENFRDCYEPTWGKHKDRTRPAVGNHEYNTSGAEPYFEYFQERAGEPGLGYYSYDRGSSWHIAVLNSNCGKVGGCGTDSPQGRWLRNDLASNPSRCTLAYFHHPLYATGSGTATPQVRPFWHILYNGGAEVILSGHAHRYERYARMTPGGARSANGIRQFVVEIGGEPGGGEIFYADAPNTQVVKTGVFGVLKLVLRADSYAWKFVPIAGQAFTDSGTTLCH